MCKRLAREQPVLARGLQPKMPKTPCYRTVFACSKLKMRTELRKQPLHFDSIGLSLLVIVMVSWEVKLSKGQEWGLAR
jgi:hypothetical protein